VVVVEPVRRDAVDDALVVVGDVDIEWLDRERHRVGIGGPGGALWLELVVMRRGDPPRAGDAEHTREECAAHHGSSRSGAGCENKSRDGRCRTSRAISLNVRLAWRRSAIAARNWRLLTRSAVRVAAFSIAASDASRPAR